MPTLSYLQVGLVLAQHGTGQSGQQVRDLQRDLRRLGYLKRGIDGDFGSGTEQAIKGLQHDLLHNSGAGKDGAAAVRMVDFNKGRVTAVNGCVDQNLAACIGELLDHAAVPPLPSSPNPHQENAKILAQIAAAAAPTVPAPFLAAILTQESGLKHFNEPKTGDEDTFITIGLDRNVEGQPHVISSRGYGAGQFTLFHHPPTRTEVQDFMLDVGKNLRQAINELKDKFDHFLNGSTSGTRADDRTAEASGQLRTCKYGATDGRYMKDCRQCLRDAGALNIAPGAPVHAGAATRFESTQYYDMTRDKAVYEAVPIRAKIGCDWPYAVRRYNGSGVNSYHYQVRILKHLLSL